MNKIRISTLFEDIFDIQFFKYWMNIEKRRYNKVLKSKMFCNSNSVLKQRNQICSLSFYLETQGINKLSCIMQIVKLVDLLNKQIQTLI